MILKSATMESLAQSRTFEFPLVFGLFFFFDPGRWGSEKRSYDLDTLSGANIKDNEALTKF